MPEFDAITFDVDTNIHNATEPLRFYTTNNITADAWTINTTRFATTEDLEHFSQKIYKIIEEHTPLDITEEEFMKLIKDDS